MLINGLFVYCILFLQVVFHKVVKYAYYQLTDLFDIKTKAFTAPVSDFLFVFRHLV